MATTASGVYMDVGVVYKPNTFLVPIFFDKNTCYFEY